MTTYTLQGIQVDWKDNVDWTDIDYTGFTPSGTLTIVAATNGGFSYTLDAPEPDNDVWANVTAQDTYSVNVDGTYIHPYESPNLFGSNVGFVEIKWTSGATSYTTILLEVSLEWGDDATGHMQGSDYYFVIGGDSLPTFSSLADFETFANTGTYIDSVNMVSGPLGAGQFIDWTDLLGIQVATEDDDILGTDGRDILEGGIGDDYFYSSAGRDVYRGGEGIDQVTFGADPNGVRVNLAKGTGTDGYGNTDKFVSIEMLRGSMHDDVFVGKAGSQIFRGLAGNDVLNGARGIDAVRYDRDANYGGTSGVTVHLGKGTATDGFGDTDTLRSIENVRGSNFNDRLSGSSGRNVLQGEDGNDKLFGLAGNDQLFGGSGKDRLDGGTGDDDLSGGAQADIFVFSGAFGNDTITDFQTAGRAEKIDLSGVASIRSFRDLNNNHLSDVNGVAVIDDGLGNTITLEGHVAADFSLNDFIF